MAEEEAGTVTGEESESAQTEEETQASTEESEASDEPAIGSQETDEDETEEQEKKSRASERIRELNNKLKEQDAQIRDLAAKFEKQQQAQQSPGAIDERALASYLEETEVQIETLKAEGKFLDAKILQRKMDKLIDDVEAHRQKEAEWKKNSTTQEQQSRQAQEAIKELDAAADFFRDQKKIPADVWDKGAEQWAEARKADPLLDRQYAEVWMRQGPIAAIQYAYDHMQKAQAAEAEKVKAEKAKKDAAKANITGPGGESKGITSWDQLMGLGSVQVAAYKKNNPKHYQQLLDNHLK